MYRLANCANGLLLFVLAAAVAAADPTITTVLPDTGGSASDGNTSATTLTVSGTADVGATVVLLFDGTNPPTTITGTPVVVSGSGTFSMTLTTGVASYAMRYLRARSTLLLDVRSSTISTLVIDPLATAPTITGISPQGQVGSTNDSTPTVNGTGDPGATVSVFADGGLVGTTTVNGSGSWSFTLTTALPDGSYDVTATQEDLAGNGESVASTSVALAIDTFHAGLTVLRSPSGLINQARPIFDGLSEVGATVELRSGAVNGPLLGAVVNTIDPWTLQPSSNLAEGAHSVYVVSVDAAGNSLNAGPFAFTIDTVPPQALVITGFVTNTGTVPSGSTTLDFTLEVVGSIAVIDAGTTVSISIDGISVSSAVANGSGIWQATVPDLTNATWTVTASASDAAGNSVAATAATINVIALRFQPVFRRALGGATSWATNDNTPTLDGTARSGTTVTFTAPEIGWPALASAVTDGANRWSFTPGSAITDGTYTVTATTSDGASTPFTVIIDSHAPSTVAFTGVSSDTGSSATDEITSDPTLVVTVGSIIDPAISSGGLTVTAFIAGIQVGSGAVDGSGNASINLTATTLTEGTHQLTLRARDGAGNNGPLSGPFPVVIDARTDTPLVQVVQTDTGRSSSDRLTQSSSATTLRGRAEAHAPISVSLNGGGPLAVTTNASGTWTLTIGALTSGAYSAVVTATDIAGNTATSAAWAFTIDNAAPATPTAIITEDRGISASDRLTNDQTLIVSGNAENSSDVVVTLTLGGTTHTRTIRATGTYSADFTNVTLAEGVWTLNVVATDAAGNISAALNTTVTIDVTLASPIIDAIADDTGRSSSDFRTQDTTLTISGTASVVADVVATVVNVNGANYTVTGTNWSQILPALTADASYLATVTTSDTAGNSRQASRTIVIDLTGPSAAITAVRQDTGASSSDFITNDQTLFIDGTTSEPDPTVLVEILEGVTVRFTGTVTVSGSAWTADATGITLSGIPRTNYTIFATPTDAAGNLGATTSQALIVDTEVPVGGATISDLDVDSRTDGDLITFDTTPDFNGSYTNAGTSEYVRVVIDGSQRAAILVAPGNGTWTWTFSGTALSDGVHTAQVQVMDDAGNVSGLSPAFSFTTDTTTSAPAAIIITTDTGIVATDKVTFDPTLTISGTAEPLATITVAVATVNASTTVLANGTWSVSLDISALADGTLTSSASVLDVAGNTNSTTFSIVFDRVAPLAPVLTGITTDSGRSTSDRTTNDRTLQIKGTAEALSYIDVSRDGTLLGRVQANGTGAWTYNATATTLPAGEYDTNYSATATDLAGNVSLLSAAMSVRIDSVNPPTRPVLTSITTDSATAADFITNDPTLVFSGTADVGGTIQAIRVQLRLNSSTLPWATPDVTGAWTVNHTATTLADGTYSASVLAQDLAGNNSATSASVQIIVDTTRPLIAITTLSVDSGRATSDFITNVTPTTISGTSEALATVTLSVTPNGGGATQQVVVTASAVGAWSATVSGLTWSQGVWNLSATATDRAGNVAIAPAAQQLTIDQTAPNAPVISGFATDSAVADGLTNDNTLVISGTGEINALIRVFIDGVERGTATVTGAGTWSFAAPVLADGAHAFTCTATDVAGNLSSVSNTLAVVIDTVTTAPILLLIFQDSANDTDRLTNDQTQVLSGRAEVGASVSVTINGQVRVVTAGVTGLWVADFTGFTLPEGIHPITIVSTDVAGNVGNGTSSLTIDITAPNAPVLVAVDDDSGASSTDFVTNDNTLILRGTAEANSTVDIFVDGVLSFTAPADGTGAWSWDARSTTLADATYELTARAIDRAGNVGALTAIQSLVVDTELLNTVQFRSFSDDTGVIGDGITADRTLTLNGVTEPSAIVTISRNGTTVATVTAGALGRFVSDQSATSLVDGTYSYSATSRDLAGNLATSTAYRIQVDGTAPLTPVLTGINRDSATANDWITNDNTLEITGTAEAYSTVEVFIDDQEVGAASVSASGVWVADLTAVVLSDGSYVVRAVATDVAGNVSLSSTSRTLVVDTTPPSAPTPRVDPDTGDSSTDGLTNAVPAGVRGEGEPGARLSVRVDGTTISTFTVAADGIWTLLLPDLSTDGAYVITTVQVDAVGNSSAISAPVTMTIDRTLGPLSITGLILDSGLPFDRVTNDNTAVLTGRADPLTRIIIQVGGATIGTVTSDAGGGWTAAATNPIADGTYSLTLIGEDAAGNVLSSGGITSVIIIDTAPPDAPVISTVADDSGVTDDFITNDQTVIFTGTAEPGTTLELFIADISLGTTPVAGDGSWTFDATFVVLPPGTFEVSARAIDLAANIGPRGVRELVIDVETSVDVEIVALTDATDSGVKGDRRTNADPIVLLGLAEAGASITVTHIGTGALSAVIADALGVWTLSVPGLTAGVQQFQAVSLDIAANPGGPSTIFTVTIDRTTTTPTIDVIDIDSYTAADFITNDTSVTISGTAEANATVALSLAGVALGNATASGTGAWNLVTGNLVDGDYAIQAIGTDVAGNSATDVSNRVLIIDTRQDAPVITALVTDSGVSDDFITSDGTPHFIGTSEANAAIVLLVDGIQVAVATADGAGLWSTPDVAVTDGDHVAVVRATDRAGNVSTSRSRAFHIDTVMATPVITMWTPDTGVPGDLITADGGLLLTGTGEADTVLVITDNGSDIATSQVSSTGQWTWNFAGTPLAHGVHSLTVTTTDVAGNSATSVALVITVDTVPPALPSITQVTATGNVVVADGAGTYDARPTVTGLAEANARVTVSVNGVDQTVVIANGSGAWSWQPSSALPIGRIEFSAVAIDAAGNRSPSALPYVIQILADQRDVHVSGCGSGALFATMLMAMLFMMLRAPRRLGNLRPLMLLLIGLISMGLQAEDQITEPQQKDSTTTIAKSLEKPADSAAVWEWGVRLLGLPQPEDQGTELDGYGDVPGGDYDNVPALGVFLRRSAPLGDSGLRWGVEGGFSIFSFSGTSSPFAGSDAVYDYQFYNIPLDARLRLDYPLGEDLRIGVAAMLSAGVAVADISGTATVGGVSQDIGNDTGYGLYTAYGVAADVAWTFDDAREWTMYLEIGYIRGRTSLEYTDRFTQGGQVVASDTYTQRVDHTGVTLGLGLMWLW